MQIRDAFEKINHEDLPENLVRKRFACAQCGKTWVELVGVVGGFKDGNDELYFHIGNESEICQTCRFRLRTCPDCGSKDAYEIKLSDARQNVPLSFEGIRRVIRR